LGNVVMYLVLVMLGVLLFGSLTRYVFNVPVVWVIEMAQFLLARVFQAIRMEVNREEDEIRAGLSAAVSALVKGGRVCVLSYHSVEDRKVKEVFGEFERDCICPRELPVCMCGGNRRVLRKVVRRPLEASAEETAVNPRARSAKLRVMEKV
jgi:16S rRNA (cytosine1402-N4)-methyltransferase